MGLGPRGWRSVGAWGPVTAAGLGMFGALAAGCGGGGGSSGATPALTSGTPAPPPPTAAPPPPPTAAPPPPPPGGGGGGPPAPPPIDDAQVRAALTAAGIGPVTLGATNAAEVALGRALFFDKELSGNRNISCATCHHPTLATGDGLPLSVGEGASGLGPARTPLSPLIARHAPTLVAVGAADLRRLFWDGRVARDPATGALTTPVAALNGTSPTRPDLAGPLGSALAAQAMFPPTSPDEMRGQPGENELADAANEEAVWAAIMVRLVGSVQARWAGSRPTGPCSRRPTRA